MRRSASERGLFWRFVALMELARVGEAEVALGAFERAADAAGDAEALAMALSRHAMLAMLRGRFDVGSELMAEFSARARQIGLPDARRLESAVLAAVKMERGSEREWEAGREQISVVARRFPGHLYEATEARILIALGRRAEAATELQRLLPQALAASGPRWLGAVADLSAVAAEVGNRAAAAQLYEAVLPYAERLVVWGGANAVNGPASYFLGLLANRLGMADRAVAHLESAISLAEGIGALPALAHCRAGLSTVVAARGADGDDGRASQLLLAAPGHASPCRRRPDRARAALATRRRHRQLLAHVRSSSDPLALSRRRSLADEALCLARHAVMTRCWPKYSTRACMRCGIQPAPRTAWKRPLR